MSTNSFPNVLYNFLVSFIVFVLVVLLFVLNGNMSFMFLLFAIFAINAINVYNMYYLLIALAIFSIVYINVNNAVLNKKRYNKQWEKVKYKFGIEYSDKPSIIYENMFNDDNRANTYDT